MKERPILFSAPMVIASRAGMKTQTRRTRGLKQINKAPDAWELHGQSCGDPNFWYFSQYDVMKQVGIRCPYGVAGDRLWVREAFCVCQGAPYGDGQSDPVVVYRADRNDPDLKYKPSIHMPRWASRDSLEVVSVRPERLQGITTADAKAEGCESCTPYDQFRVLWESINGPGSWARNCWLWRIEYRKVQAGRFVK